MNDIKKNIGIRRSIDFFDEQNHCFFRNEKSKKIFSKILKIFFILDFEKKSVTFFSAKNFCGKIFWRKSDFHYNSQHTSKNVCVWTKNRQKIKILNCFQFKMKKRR
jgi:hypothetical protein